jgi:hypothetical protein
MKKNETAASARTQYSENALSAPARQHELLHQSRPLITTITSAPNSTNARKYGALKVPEGRLSVTWHRAGDFVEISWAESGGPKVNPPSRRGFGTLLIERGLKVSLGGEARITFAPTGLTCDMRLPLP